MSWCVPQLISPERTADNKYCRREDCGGARAKDKSYYLLEPSGTRGGDGPLRARVNCSEDEGLPVDGGGAVAVGGEVVVEIKPGAFGEPWQAGYRAG